MIETRERYEFLKGETDVRVKDAVETIETLRDVARVAENALTYDNQRGIWTLSDEFAQDMQEAYARISDWITEDD